MENPAASDDRIRRVLARIERPVAAAAAELLRPAACRDRMALAEALALLRAGVRELDGIAGRSGVARGGTPGQRQLRDLRRQIGRAARVAALAEQAADAPPVPLYPAALAGREPLAQQILLLDLTFRALHDVVNPAEQDGPARAFGCYPDLPLPASVFVTHLQAARRVCRALRRAGPLTFLDVGCGGGTKVLMAASVFDRADGLEYDPGYAAAAARLMAQTAMPGRIIEGDALQFAGYGGYDVIYFYRPMSDPALLQQMEDRIIAGARPGTVLIAPYDTFRDRDHPRCHPVAGAVHVTGPGIGVARADLRAEAERAGTGLVPPRPGKGNARPGFLAPLIDALATLGWLE